MLFQKWKRINEKIKKGALREMMEEIRWIFRYIIKYRKAIIFYIFIGVLGTLMGLAGSVASKYMIDAVTQRKESLLFLMLGISVMTGVGAIILKAITSKVLANISLVINKEILEEVYFRILNTKWNVMNEYQSGDLLNRLNNDVSMISNSVLGWLPTLIINSVHFLGSLLLILFYDPTMGVFALCSAPVTVFLSRMLIYKMRDYNKKMFQSRSDMMAFTNESFQKIQSIKSLHLIELFKNRLDDVQGKYIKNAVDYNEFSVKTSAWLSFVSLAVSLLCLGWGVFRLWTGHITYGTMTLFLQLAKSLSSDFSSLIQMVPSAISATTSARRIMDITELEKESMGNTENIEAIEAEAERGIGIRLKDILFSYEKGDTVLKDINLTVNPGEIVALMGHSGCGKTTLLRIILGIVTLQNGTAELFTVSGKSEPFGAGTRQLISYVPQGNTVFSGTIADNLRMVDPEASDTKIEEALKTACAWEFVSAMPEGIHSVVGENGTGLSEGQAQRISIARAVLKKAPIILFDEATSALDEETGEIILENIKKKMKNCTCILVTHRTSILKVCTKIYKMRDHEIVEQDGVAY